MLRYLAYGIAVLLYGPVTLRAATPLTCVWQDAGLLRLRAPGFMEQLPDTIIVCNGGEPAAVGVPLPFKTITVTLLEGVDLTSRTLATSGGQVWTEALAAVDEPSPENQQACEAPDGRCAGRGVGAGMGAYLGRLVFNGNPNIYQGFRVSRSAVSFTIPWADPGTLTSRIVRLTNLRVNTNSLSIPFGGSAAIRWRLDIDGTPVRPLGNDVAAQAEEVMNRFWDTFTFRPEGATVRHKIGTITFEELYPHFAAWRRRTIALPSSDLPGGVADQDLPGTSYQTESQFVSRRLPNIPGRGNLANAGLAESGTRLLARIQRIDPAVRLWVRTIVPVLSGSNSTRTGTVRLMVSGGTGTEPFTPAQADSEGLAPLNVSGGQAAAEWEVLSADTTTHEKIEVDVFATYPAGAAPPLGERLLAPAALDSMAQAPAFAVPGGTANGCGYFVANQFITVPATGGVAEVFIDTTPGCGWKVDFSSGTFVFSDSSRSHWQGRGVARWRVLPNTGPPRAAALVIQGINVTIYQRGGAKTNLPPPTVLSPSVNERISTNAVRVSWQLPAGQQGVSGVSLTVVRRAIPTISKGEIVTESNAPVSTSSALFSLPIGFYSVLARTCAGGFDDQSCGSYSTADFDVITGPNPGAQTAMVSPVGFFTAKFTRSTNEFRWTPVTGATWYRMEIKSFSGIPVASVRVDAPATSTILTLPSGAYQLRVNACSESCFTPFNSVGFTVELPPVPTTAPAVTQSSITQGNLLDVAWTAVPGADLYQVQVVQPSSGPGGGALTVAARQVSTTSVQMPVPSGPASVLVSACTGDGCGPFSLPVPIQPPGPNPAAPVIGTPMSGVLTMGPAVLFTWGRVPGDNGTNTTYRLYVADLSLSGTAADVYTTSNFAAVQVQTDGRRYDAVVVAHPGQPNQIQGPSTGFQAGGSAPFAPVLVSPAHGGRVRQGMVRLGWAPFGDGPFQYYVSSVGGAYTASGTAAGTFVELPLAVLNGQPTAYSAVVRACGLDTFARNWYACDPASEQFWAPWSNSPGGSGVTMFTLLP